MKKITMEEEKKKKKDRFNYDFIAITALLLVFIITMLSIVCETEKEFQDRLQEFEKVIHQKDSTIKNLELKYDSLHILNWDNIDYWMQNFGIQHQNIVKRQIIIETANLNSYLCREQNNLFGMRHPRVRETTSQGSKYGHAYYDSYIDSIKDYALWQQSQYNDQEDYYAFLLDIGYAEDKFYTQTLKKTKI